MCFWNIGIDADDIELYKNPHLFIYLFTYLFVNADKTDATVTSIDTYLSTCKGHEKHY
jgi:hypothetical protein